jgi:hypothetical protein
MNIKLIIKSLLVSCLFFVGFAVFATQAKASPRLYFEPTSQEVKRDTDFTVNILIDVESQSAFGADAVINFPSGDITVKSITKGEFFSHFSQAQGTGKLELHGYFAAPFESKSGGGKFATLTLSSNKDSGSGSLTFTCTGSGADTQILNSGGTNILSCASLNTQTLNYISAATGGTSTDGPTNACGGTCGSHYNCNSGLFCFEGFCRNPLCSSDTTCGCKVTPSPKPKTTVRSLAKATPEIIVLKDYVPPTPQPSLKPLSTMVGFADQEAAATKAKGFDLRRIGLIALVIAIITTLIVVVSRNLRKKNSPPEIKPPTIYPPINNPPSYPGPETTPPTTPTTPI